MKIQKVFFDLLDWLFDRQNQIWPIIPLCIIFAFLLPFLLLDPTPTNGTSGRLGGIAAGCVGWIFIAIIALIIYVVI